MLQFRQDLRCPAQRQVRVDPVGERGAAQFPQPYRCGLGEEGALSLRELLAAPQAQRLAQRPRRGIDELTDVPSDFVWVTPGQSERLPRHGYYLNMQARTLLAALRSVVWSPQFAGR